jgi:hypothetical protein
MLSIAATIWLGRVDGIALQGSEVGKRDRRGILAELEFGD